MQDLPRVLVDKFAETYAGDRIGFSAKQITDYFESYSNLVKPLEHYQFRPKRKDLFIEALFSLSPKQQYYALNDLTLFSHPSRYQYPSKEDREKIRHELHNFISTTPIGLFFSSIQEVSFREDWIECQSRLLTDPSAAITASRTLLETILKTIISERGSTIKDSADLSQLLKQAEHALNFDRNNHQAEHQIFSGLTNVINGIATISNAAGDRHGTVGGKSIDNLYFANLCINAAGTVGLAFIELHHFTPYEKV